MIFNNKRLDQLETEVRELGAELLRFKFRVVDLEKALKDKEPNSDRRKTDKDGTSNGKSSGKRGI